MTVKLRLDDDPDEIADILDVATPSAPYPNRTGFGVRTYVEVRLPTTSTVTAERPGDQPALPAAPRTTPAHR